MFFHFKLKRPPRTWGDAWFKVYILSIYLKYISKNLYKTTYNPIGKPNNAPPIKIPMIN